MRHAHDDRVELGVGLGPYVAVDRYRHASDDGALARLINLDGERSEALAGLVSLSVRYAPATQWHVRTTWHRVLANYHRDTDVFLVGLGYGF